MRAFFNKIIRFLSSLCYYRKSNHIKIIFKFDDLNRLSRKMIKLTNFSHRYGIKFSLGIIGNSLENPSPEYIDWILKQQKSGYFQIWNHGYTHSDSPYEFKG